jgi:hypothetical protein
MATALWHIRLANLTDIAATVVGSIAKSTNLLGTRYFRR